MVFLTCCIFFIFFSQLEQELGYVTNSASKVRDAFVIGIAKILSENKLNKALHQELNTTRFNLEKIKKSKDFVGQQNDNNIKRIEPEVEVEVDDTNTSKSNIHKKDTEKNVDEVELVSSGVVAVGSKAKITECLPSTLPPPSPSMKVHALIELEENLLLQIFSFLTTNDILCAAQLCRGMYRRVDSIFGIDENNMVSKWGEGDQNSSSVDNTDNKIVNDERVDALGPRHDTSAANSSNGNSGSITRDMVEQLTKKLSQTELKFFQTLSENMKKMTAQRDSLQMDLNDIVDRVNNAESVRDFLIEKLKTAELAIKGMMSDNSNLQKELEKDKEIISYLDLKNRTLQSNNEKLEAHCNHLVATLDLQVNADKNKDETMKEELKRMRSELVALDTNSKKEKKILVREVKSLRAQTEALKKEKAVLQSQIKQVREVMSISYNG